MANGIIDIDHVMCRVADTEAARDDFDRLGFATSPRSSIPDDGVCNRLVVLTPRGDGVANFLELMAVEDPDRLTPALGRMLAGGEGIKSLVNGLDDADTARQRHREIGLAMLPVWPRQRLWRLPSGEELMIRFRVLVPEPGQSPLTFNGVEYLTLEHYLRPEFQRHPNGALRWTGVTAVVDEQDLERRVGLFERLYGTEAKVEDGASTIHVRDTHLRLVNPPTLARLYGEVDLSSFTPPAYCCITIEVADLDGAAALLSTNGVTHTRDERRILIGPAEACGNVLELITAPFSERRSRS